MKSPAAIGTRAGITLRPGLSVASGPLATAVKLPAPFMVQHLQFDWNASVGCLKTLNEVITPVKDALAAGTPGAVAV